jgi:hypothetical protein
MVVGLKGLKSTLNFKVMKRNWDLQIFIGGWWGIGGLNCCERWADLRWVGF